MNKGFTDFFRLFNFHNLENQVCFLESNRGRNMLSFKSEYPFCLIQDNCVAHNQAGTCDSDKKFKLLPKDR